MTLSLIVAMSENRVIGRDGGLPWRLSADLRRFKRLTMGHHLLMGRKTFAAIGRLLPGRTSVVISRQADYTAPGAVVVHDFAEACQVAQGDDQVFVVGGGEIYRHALPQVERLYITLIHTPVSGDTYFPEWNEHEWRLLEATRQPRDAQNEFDYSFLTYERVSAMSEQAKQELLSLTHQLLDCIARADWDAYQLLCDPTITCFEPEARNHLVEGLDFHRYYFALGARKTPANTTICAPQVRMLGADAAVISYVRLVQSLNDAGVPQTSRSEETRVWHKTAAGWRHVHFHRSVS